MAHSPTAQRQEITAAATDSLDDASILVRHAALESSNLSHNIVFEVQRSWEALQSLEASAQLEKLVTVIEAAVKVQADSFVAFHTMLLQRVTDKITDDKSVLDRVAIADRAALLRVRLALEAQKPANWPSKVASSQQPGSPPEARVNKSRSALGVRWSLSDHEEHSRADGSHRKSSTSLCLHAFEALRGSVQAMEEQQPPSAGTSCSASCVSSAGVTAKSDCSQDRSMIASCAVHDAPASSANASSACSRRDGSPSAQSMSCSHEGREGLTVKWCQSQPNSVNEDVPNPAVSRSPSRSSLKPIQTQRNGSFGSRRGWDTIRAVLVPSAKHASSVSSRSNRRATIRRLMASEPGAEESDLRQLRMLRQRSCSCAAPVRNTRRVAPGEREPSSPSPCNSSVVSLSRDSDNRTSEMSSVSCRASDLSSSCGNKVGSGGEQRQASDPSETRADSTALRQSSSSCRSSWEEATTRASSRLMLTPHAGPSAGLGAASEASRGDAELLEALKTPSTLPSNALHHQPARRKSIERAFGSRRTSLRTSVENLFARTRRGSVSEHMGAVRSRRESSGASHSASRGSRLMVASRRASTCGSRRGSLSDMYISLQSTMSTNGTASLAAAAAAFFLTDVTCEAQRSRIRHASISTVCSASAVPPLVHQTSSTQLNVATSDRTVASARESLLGAVSGDPLASAKLRASLVHARRRSSILGGGQQVGQTQKVHGVHADEGSPPPALRRGSITTHARQGEAACLSASSGGGAHDTTHSFPGSMALPNPKQASTNEPESDAHASYNSSQPNSMRIQSQDILPGIVGPPRGSLNEISDLPPSAPHSFVNKQPESVYARTTVDAFTSEFVNESRLPRACQFLCTSYDSLPLVVLHPLSRLCLYWDALVAIFSLYSLIEVPLRIVFAPHDRFGYLNIASINYVATVLFVLQPLMETRTIVVKRGAPEARPSIILWHYLQSWRLPRDLISCCCPLLDMLWNPLALVCAVRVTYLLNFVTKLEKATKTSPSVIRSVQIMLGALPTLHWFACIFCYLALSPGSWFEAYQLERGEPLNTSDSRIYLHAAYWTLDTASTRGSGEMNASTDAEVVVMCCVITLSTLFYSAIIANMSTLLLSSDSTWNDHRRRVEVLKAFMRHRKLPTRLRQRIQNFLDYMWATQKGINEDQILQELPETLQKQVTLFCAKHVIDKVPLFRGCSPDVSASIIASLEPRVYVPQDLIIERGAWGDEFFIISEGVVVQLEDVNGAPLAYLQAGAYFGELAALLGGPRRESFMALTHCFLYSLKHDALEDILHRHPECIDSMLSNMCTPYYLTDIKARLDEIEAASNKATAVTIA